MRARHVLVLLAVAAVPVGLAVALTTGSGGSPAGASMGTQVSLHLVGGASVAGVRACGVVHHYKRYGSTGMIRFRGLVTPAGVVKVKVKLKACSADTFQPSGEVIAKEHADGVYKGSFQAPTPGYYFARAEVKRSGMLLARSEKRYFTVR